MAWPAHEALWGAFLADVRRDVAAVAQAISQFEPVVMCVRPDQRPHAERLCGSTVEYFEVDLDDLWIRDTGPSFLLDGQGGLAGSTWNFNGRGAKQVHADDAALADRILGRAGAWAFRAPIVTEGGALAVDGDGTLICTESSILNQNRNPGLTRDVATRVLMGWLGVDKVVWLADPDPDAATDGHINGVLRFVEPGHVLFEMDWPVAGERAQSLLRSLEQETDARGRSFRVTPLYPPSQHAQMDNRGFCDSYVNFYLANSGVVMLAFGDDESDARACQTLSEAFPDRRVVQLRADTLCTGGGGIYDVTLHEPAAGRSSIFASQDLDDAQYRAVTAHGALAFNSGVAAGFLLNRPRSGEAAEVLRAGRGPVRAGQFLFRGEPFDVGRDGFVYYSRSAPGTPPMGHVEADAASGDVAQAHFDTTFAMSLAGVRNELDPIQKSWPDEDSVTSGTTWITVPDSGEPFYAQLDDYLGQDGNVSAARSSNARGELRDSFRVRMQGIAPYAIGQPAWFELNTQGIGVARPLGFRVYNSDSLVMSSTIWTGNSYTQVQSVGMPDSIASSFSNWLGLYVEFTRMTSHDLGVSNVTFVAPPGLVPDIRQPVEVAYDLPGVSLGQWEFDALGQVGMFVEKLPGGEARLWGGLIAQDGEHAGEFTTPDPRQLDCGLIGSEPVQLGNSRAGPAFIAVNSSNQFVITTIDTRTIVRSHVTVYSGWAMDPDDADERAKRQGLGMLRNATTPGQWATYKYNGPDGSVQLRLVDLVAAPRLHYTVFSHGPPPPDRPDPMIVAPVRGMPRVPGADPGRNLIYTGMYLSSGDKAPLQIVEIDVTCAALPTQTVIVSNSLHKPFGNPFMYRGKRHYICAGHALNDITFNELHIYREPHHGQYWDRVQEISVGSCWVPHFRSPGQLHSPEPTVVPDVDGNIVIAFNVQDRSTALSALEFSGFGALAIAVVGKPDSVFVVRDPAPWEPIVEPEVVVTPAGRVVVYFEKSRNGRQLTFDDIDSQVYRVKLEPSNMIARKAAVVNSAYGGG